MDVQKIEKDQKIQDEIQEEEVQKKNLEISVFPNIHLVLFDYFYNLFELFTFITCFVPFTFFRTMDRETFHS